MLIEGGLRAYGMQRIVGLFLFSQSDIMINIMISCELTHCRVIFGWKVLRIQIITLSNLRVNLADERKEQ